MQRVAFSTGPQTSASSRTHRTAPAFVTQSLAKAPAPAAITAISTKCTPTSERTSSQTTGSVKTSVQMIEDALAAKTDVSRPALGGKESERDELHRLAALWVSKCGQPQPIVDDAELSTLLARILELRKAKLRYQLPSRNTLATHLTMLGYEGKVLLLGRDFVVRLLLQSAVRRQA